MVSIGQMRDFTNTVEKPLRQENPLCLVALFGVLNKTFTSRYFLRKGAQQVTSCQNF